MVDKVTKSELEKQERIRLENEAKANALAQTSPLAQPQPPVLNNTTGEYLGSGGSDFTEPQSQDTTGGRSEEQLEADRRWRDKARAERQNQRFLEERENGLKPEAPQGGFGGFIRGAPRMIGDFSNYLREKMEDSITLDEPRPPIIKKPSNDGLSRFDSLVEDVKWGATNQLAFIRKDLEPVAAGLGAAKDYVFNADSPSLGESYTQRRDDQTAPVPVGTIDPNSAFNPPLATPQIPSPESVGLSTVEWMKPMAAQTQRGEPGSMQENFANRMMNRIPLSEQEIAQANEFAKSKGVEFDPVRGYSAAQPQPQIPVSEYQPQLGVGIGLDKTFDDFGVAGMFDEQSEKYGTPMTGMRPINPNTGQPMSQQEIDTANRAGVPLAQASVPQASMQPQAPIAPMGQDATRERLQQIFGTADPVTLNQGLSGNPNATIQVQDAQGRFRRQAAPVAGETPEQNLARTNAILTEQADFNQASEDRKQRIDNRPDFGTAYSNQELRDMGDPRGGVVSGGSSGAPTALYKKEAEEKGLTGRAKSDYVSEKTRLWSEDQQDRKTAQEDREIAQSSAEAAAARAKIELGLRVSEEERLVVKAEDAKIEKMNMATAAIQGALQNLRLMEGVSEEIKGLTFKSLTEGNFGRAMSFLSPTSTAAQIDRMTETIAGDAFVDSILALKRMGGTVGQVSNAEGEKLTAAKQRLMKSGMGGPERRKALEEYMQIKRQSVQELYIAYAGQYGQAEAQKAFGGSAPKQGGGSSIPNDRNVAGQSEDLLSSGKYD